MKLSQQLYFLLFFGLMALVGCSGIADELEDSFDSSSAGGSSSSAEGEDIENGEGLITAGEWNDLHNWNFWKEVIQNQEFEPASRWGISTAQRVSVVVLEGTTPMVDVRVEVSRTAGQGTPEMTLWTARTDNFGMAELWLNAFDRDIQFDLSQLVFYTNGTTLLGNAVHFYEDGVITLVAPPNANSSSKTVDLSFIVDATSSMADELEFIKDDLEDVITRVESGNSGLSVRTSTVFYRDEGDEYLVRHSDFEEDLDKTLDFIDNQSARGGGDFPEAVHTGLETSISGLAWSQEARARIAFLILDAPPHEEDQVTESVRAQIKEAARKGIKIIPITASGIDKPTELLMRQMAILTNGTYVFITNDSGIGGDHIEASVGEYEVEFLNDLMVRLIKKYTD